jgi:colicin import membrane protein
VGSNNVAKTVNTPSVTLPTVPVEAALQEWIKAWSDRRADDYLNFYDARYAPLGGVERAIWAKQRRKAIRHPDWVKVRAEQVSTTEISPEEVVVGFTQVYSASTGHRETTRKSMIWRWSDGHWRIVSEQAAKMAATAKTVAPGPEEPAQVVEAKLPQAPEPKVPESKTATRLQRETDATQSKAQRELEAVEAALAKLQREAEALQARARSNAEAAQLKAQRDAEAAQLKAQREAELAASRAKREAELASGRAELESKQAAAKAAREVQLNAEKAAHEAEVSAKQAKRDVEIAAAAARKEEKRLARELLSVAPAASASARPAPARSSLWAPHRNVHGGQ